MSIPRLSVRARLVLLLVFVNAALLGAAGYAWYALARLNTEFNSAIARQNQVEAASDLARRAQLEFWEQLRVWGLVLLAGEEAQSQHLGTFADRGGKVMEHLEALDGQLKALGIPEELARDAMKEHRAVTARYLSAGKALRAGNLASVLEASGVVRAMDRAVIERMDTLVKAIQKRGDELAGEA